MLKDARVWKDEFEGHLLEIEQKCNLCKTYAKTPPRLVVSMLMAKEFNEIVAMDLKQYKGCWILYSTRNVNLYMINNRIGYTHDRIGYMINAKPDK